MQFDPAKRPTAIECLEHDFFKDFEPPVQSSVLGKSNKSFFNKSNDINSGVRKPSAVSKRLESRKSKLGSSGINKDSFYKTKNKIPAKIPVKAPPGSYFNNPVKTGSGSGSGSGSYSGIGKYLKNRNANMASRERNRNIPSGDAKSKIFKQDSNSSSILGKYSKNYQGMTGAQNYQPGGGLSKGVASEAYGIYGKNSGGLGNGGLGKVDRADSSSNMEKPPSYGSYGGYGGGGMSKYVKNGADKGKLPNVTNRQALGSGVSIGSNRNIGSELGSKSGSRGNIPSGGGLQGYGGRRKKGTDAELPNLNKYSNSSGLGGLRKGGMAKGGLGVMSGSGLGKGGLGRNNL